MVDFTTPLGLRSDGQFWNINVVNDSTSSLFGNLTFNANSLTVGNTVLQIDDETGHTSIGNFPPSDLSRLSVGSGSAIGIQGIGNQIGVNGVSSEVGVSGATAGDGIAVIGNATALGGPDALAGVFFGDVEVTGNLCAGSFSFCISSPINPANASLNHASVGSSEMLNVYSGNTTLDENGEAWVELPDWFEALNCNFRYQLTCIGEFASVYIAEEVSDNHFKIAGGNPGMKLSWQLTGVRQDPWAQANPLVVEEKRSANEQGYYQHPLLHNQPKEKSIYSARYPEIMRLLKEDMQRLLANTGNEASE